MVGGEGRNGKALGPFQGRPMKAGLEKPQSTLSETVEARRPREVGQDVGVTVTFSSLCLK